MAAFPARGNCRPQFVFSSPRGQPRRTVAGGIRFARGRQKYQFDFKVADGKLEATAAAEMGDQKRGVEFLDEKIDGDTITFAELRKFQDNEMRIEYTGKVTDKGIAFTRKVGEFGSAEFVASRVGPPPAPATAAGPVPSPTNIPGRSFRRSILTVK